MKRYIIITTCLIAWTLGATAQQLPNSGFEDWNGAQFADNIQPSNWNYSNVSQAGFNFNFAHREAGHSGNYCAMVQDQEVGAMGITETAPGYLSLGQPWSYAEITKLSEATAGTAGGIKFTYRPDSMRVWIKRTGSNVDKENYNIVFYSWIGTSTGSKFKGKGGGCTSIIKYDEESNIRQATDRSECGTDVFVTQVAEGWIKEKKAYNNWTLITIPIYYNSNDKPEKCNVIFSAGNYPNFSATTGLYAGNTLCVDDVELIYSAHIDELYINNRKWGGFDPKKTQGEEQTYALGLGATDIPDIFAKRGVGSLKNSKGETANFAGRVLSGSEITIDKTGASVGGSPVTITVKSEDGTKTATYKIKFVAEQSSNSRPSAISYTLDGEIFEIPNFSGYINTYNVELPYGTTSAPNIDAEKNITKGDDGQTVSVTQATSPKGTAIVTVTAANGSASTYTINFSVGKLTDNTLKNILIGDASLPGFSPTKTNYTVELPLGTTKLPEITPVSAYAKGEQTITITNGVTISGDNCTGTYNIAVKAPGNNTTRTYKLSFKITASTYSFLSDLQLDGKTIDKWNPETFTYYVNLPLGTEKLPTISWTAGDSYQKIEADDSNISGTNGTYKITVTAASGAQSIYKIIFSTEKSSVSTLKAIYLNGELLPNFDEYTFTYTYELPIGTINLPEISYIRGDIYQSEPTILTNGINGVTRIITHAQDGSSSTYTIAFSVKQADNSKLKNLSVEGYELNFSPDKTDYSITLTRGTTSLPEIKYEVADEFQKVSIKEGGINGETKITVRAQTGATTVYTIKFSVEMSSDATLSDIKLNGKSIEDFDKNTLTYTIELPAGTTSLPLITYTKGDYAQNVQLYKGDINGETRIVVTAEDGTKCTYTLVFSVLKSANAFLNNIFVDGVALEGFNKEIFNYTYILNAEQTSCPAITVDKNAGQSISIVKPLRLGTATIIVTPEVGTQNTYSIRFTDRALNSNSLLSNIQLDGINLEGFNSETLTYNISLPENTTKIPEITPIKGNESQKILVANNGVNATSYIVVTAEDNSTTRYELTFTLVKSNDATLKSIKLDGVEISGFDSQKFDYTNTLPIGATSAPNMTFEGNSLGQIYTVIEPTLDGKAQIFVTSADGKAHNTYTITHVASKRTDATIDGISINDEAITGFTPEQSDYTVDMAANAVAPTIGLEIDSTQYIVVADGGLNGTQIAVAAEDGTNKTYNIDYNLQPSDNAELKDLQIYNGIEYVSIDDFASSTYIYTDSLAWRTTAVPSINPVPNDKNQTITIFYGAVNDTTIIRVTAEDKIHSADYKIYFPIAKSSLTALDNLTIDDAELLPEFHADSLNYVAKLSYGTKIVPTIRWEYGKIGNTVVTEQRIELQDAGLRDTAQVTVIAENGERRTYNITFEVAESDSENGLISYIVDGVGQFTELNDTVELPYGSTSMPTIRCIKKYEEQSVIIDNGGIYAPTTIIVKANREGVADVVYTLTPKMARPQATLDSIYVNGVAIENFEPTKYQYVVAVDNGEGEMPNVTTKYDSNKAMIDEQNDGTKKSTIIVSGKEDNSHATYTIYYYYTQDTLTNANFTEWTTATATTSAQKPTGWNVLADFAVPTEVKSSTTILGLPIGQLFSKGTYTPGNEVTQDGEFVKLTTSNSSVIDGAMPGLITLGTINASLNDGSSSTAVVGGRNFRNTPDEVSMRYNPVSKSNVNSMYFAYSLGSNQYLKEFTDANFNNQWKTMTLSLLDNTVEDPSQMNIIISGCETTNVSALNKNAKSEMLVDWVKFAYNSKIAKIFVNGKEAVGFKGKYDGGWIQAVKVDADMQGAPTLTFEGETNDQEYTYTYGEEVENCSGEYRTRIVTITSKAEDGTLSHYVLNLNRPFSSNADLAGIIIAGDTLKNFAANKFAYEVEVPNGTQFTPDIVAIRGSMHQQIKVSTTGLSDTIFVTAENGTKQTYVINFVENKSNDATLANLAIEGNPELLTFEAETENYEVNLAANATLPNVLFEKQSDGQSVTMTTGDTTRLVVTAENGVDTKTYSINFKWEKPETSGLLANMNVIGEQPLQGFDKNTFEYEYSTNSLPATISERVDATDTLKQVITSDSIVWNVIGSETHQYKLLVKHTPSDNTDLATILIDGEPMANFNAKVNEYIIESDQKAPIVLVGIRGEDTQTLEAEINVLDSTINDAEIYAEAVIYVMSEAQRLANQPQNSQMRKAARNAKGVATHIYLARKKSDNAWLKAIMLNGDTLTTSAPTYTADKAFAAEELNYNITLNCANPKVEEPAMPSITFKAGDAYQTILLEENGINATSYITVTAENGNSNLYSLNIVSEKSGNAELTSIAVNNVAIPYFRSDSLNYEVELQENAIPEISYTTEDKFQKNVELEISLSKAVYTVTAENGDTQIYTVTFKQAEKSHNALLSQIEIDNQQLEGFEPNKNDYVIMLPSGTTTLPDVVAILGEDGQTVQINYNDGLRDTTEIVVTAPDGYTTQTYRIYFDVELSSNTLLKMIYLDGDSLLMNNQNFSVDKDFASEIEVYNIVLPVGVRNFPEITWEAGDKWQNIAIDTTNLEKYTAEFDIIVTAENSDSKTYILNFEVEKSAVDTLANLYLIVNDVEENITLQSEKYTSDYAFAGTQNDYHITWNVGVRDSVKVTFERGDTLQTVEILRQMQSLNDTAIVKVTAENGNERTYTIYNTLLLSAVDTLKNVFFNNLPYQDFDADTHEYNIVLPYGTTEIPEITWENGDEYQTVVLENNMDSLSGNYQLIVTAENGDINIYTFNISVAKSSDALLDNIFIDGININGFVDEITDYVITLPYGTTEVPEITWETGEANQTVTITGGESVNDTIFITVTAEDGTTTITYRISFIFALSDNALLDNIFIGGEALDSLATKFTTDANFEPEQYEYHVVFPYGTTELPEITWKAQLPDSVYTSITLVNDSDALHGTSIITVVSQDGMQTNEYALHFDIALSDNNKLKDLYFVNVDYPDFNPLFNPDSTEYTLNYEFGSTEKDFPMLENVRYVKGDNDQVVELSHATTTKEIAVSDTTLTLTYEGVLQKIVDGNIVLDTIVAGTNVTVAAGDTLHTMIDTENKAIILISVTAQNGSTNIYAVTFAIEKSNNALLKDIIINNISLKDFEPEIFDYTYIILKGAALPTFEGVASDPNTQTIEYGEDRDNAYRKYIYCTAENGESNTYTITFVESTDNPGDTPTPEDVCWTPLGGGSFKASTSRNGVSVAIFDTAGRLITLRKIPLVDPNDQICDAGAAGIVFRLQKTGKALIYTFYYNDKEVITQGKFIY